MSAFRAMLVANIRMTVRNRNALFWLLAFPVIFIVLFGYLFSDGSSQINVGIVGAETSDVTRSVVQQMQAVDGFEVTLGDRASELAALEDAERQVVIVFSPGAGTAQVNADLYFDQTQPQMSQIALAAVQQFLSQANAALTDAPQLIAIQTQGIEVDDTSYIDFLVPGILAMSIMNSGLVGLSSTFVSYRERGILRRIKATPFSLTGFIMARIINQVLIAVAQSVVLLGLAWILFGLSIQGHIIWLFLMIILGALAFLSLGFLISGIAQNSEVADSLSNAVSFPMLFLGGVFFPVDSAPAWLQPITRIVPLAYLADGLREIMLNGQSLLGVWLDVLVLLGTALIGLVLSVRYFKWEARAV